MNNLIYLDNAATTFCSQIVAQKLAEFFSMPHGNPSGVHKLSLKSAKLIQEAREFFATSFQVKPTQVIFTASGTEANNLALSGMLQRSKRRIILTTPIEHASVLKTLESWAKRGFELCFLKINSQGQVDLDDLAQKLSAETALVSVMAVNNEIGTTAPLKTMGEIIRKKNRNILFHVDAVQAFGKVPLEFKNWNIDLLSISSHKIHGPIGAGALIMSDRVLLEPLLYGGGQEDGLRSGTESVGMILGFYWAAEDILKNQLENHQRILELKAYFMEGLKKLSCDIQMNSPEQSSPYILNISFKGCESEVLIRMLEEENIFTSSGASCNSRHRKSSHVLKAIGLSDKDIFGTIRFSFSPETKKEEIDKTLEILPRILERLRYVSH